ncbi:hypothetical protein ANCCAN_14976 [Ancylostoma caninum]|uniref:Interleukin-17 n=1 Tax=Ancylostoma caninum TaxID=29170 RepID=A0A368G3T4_ANCCA|nr:hypothetical protein ANCCAN_14976 [Ancylostoma caninum]
MRESLEGIGAEVDEDWTPPSSEPAICSKSPRAEGDTTVMQRAMCPWESRFACHCILFQVPVLRRISCDTETGHWRYERASLSITVGCHSVLPRTQRATSLSRHYRKHSDDAV